MIKTQRGVLCAVAALAVGQAAGQGTATIERGDQVFQYWCAPCHAPGPKHPGTQALDALYRGQKPGALEERTDLVPAFVETVKGYAAHERKLFEDVTAIRSASIAASSVKTQENAERELKGALSKIIALQEAYPNLKADQNFLKLQEQLAEIEDHLQMARRYYNGSVRNLNIAIQSFPNVLLARPLGFEEAEFFEADEGEGATPRVTFERAAS